MQELAEKKLTQVRHQGSTFPVLESKEAQAATQTLERYASSLDFHYSYHIVRLRCVSHRTCRGYPDFCASIV